MYPGPNRRVARNGSPPAIQGASTIPQKTPPAASRPAMILGIKRQCILPPHEPAKPHEPLLPKRHFGVHQLVTYLAIVIGNPDGTGPVDPHITCQVTDWSPSLSSAAGSQSPLCSSAWRFAWPKSSGRPPIDAQASAGVIPNRMRSYRSRSRPRGPDNCTLITAMATAARHAMSSNQQ